MNQYDLTISTGSNYTKIFTIKNSGVPMSLVGYSATLYIVKEPGVLSAISFSTTDGHITNGGALGTLTLALTPTDISTIDGNFYKLEISDGTIQTEILTGNIFLRAELKPGINYLIPYLRLKIGDTDPLTYKYMDEWLSVALIAAVRGLERYWSNKYFVSDEGIVTRNDEYLDFTYEEDEGTIQTMDENIIVIKAALIVLEGSLENHSWDIGSWRDAEISYSNIASGSIRESTVKRLQAELDMYLKSPQKKLSSSHRMSILTTNV